MGTKLYERLIDPSLRAKHELQARLALFTAKCKKQDRDYQVRYYGEPHLLRCPYIRPHLREAR